MVMVLVFFAVSILSSTAGSICGIGGGVIIKPVLDALGVMSVSSISFLSGCTVLAMSVVSAGVAWYIHTRRQRTKVDGQLEEDDTKNPLEFKVALIFALLFVVFTLLTHYTLVYAGTQGLNVLSFVSGFSDITPFILNLVQGTGGVAVLVIAACSLQAIISNIVINMCYALFFAGRKSLLRRPWILGGFGCVIAANVALLLVFYYL